MESGSEGVDPLLLLPPGCTFSSGILLLVDAFDEVSDLFLEKSSTFLPLKEETDIDI